VSPKTAPRLILSMGMTIKVWVCLLFFIACAARADDSAGIVLPSRAHYTAAEPAKQWRPAKTQMVNDRLKELRPLGYLSDEPEKPKKKSK
jgi:hypothetical protein